MPHLRFYAGALLKTEDGHAIGTICVLDYKVRALTERQTDAMRRLARQVMAQLNLRRALRQRLESDARLQTAVEASLGRLERAKGFEPSTPTLARSGLSFAPLLSASIHHYKTISYNRFATLTPDQSALRLR